MTTIQYLPETFLAMSVPDAAVALGISRALAWQLVMTGEIKSFRAGRRRLVSRDAIVEWIRGQEEAEKTIERSGLATAAV